MLIKLPDNTIDLTALEKGDFLSEAFLREITGYDPQENEQVYRIDVMKLRAAILKARPFSVRHEGYSLRILTDADASFYEHGNNEKHRRGQTRSYSRLAQVDENNLDDATRNQHRKFIEQDSRFLSAQQSAEKEIRLQQARERISRIAQEQPIRLVSNGGKTNGTTENGSDNQGDSTATAPQRANGEPAKSSGEGVEKINQ